MEGYDVLSLYCKAADYDAATGVCAAPFYGPYLGAFPVLSAADGTIIAACIVSVWVVGWKIRMARRAAR